MAGRISAPIGERGRQLSEVTEERRSGAVDGFIRAVDALAIVGTHLAAACLVALTFLMLAQISVAALSRIVPTIRGDIPIVWEYGSYLMGATFMLGSAMTLRAGRHIRLGLVTDNASPRLSGIMDLIVSLMALILVGFLTFSMGRGAINALIAGTTSIASRTPLWIPLSVFALGSLLLALQLVARIAATLTGRPVEDAALRVEARED